MVVRGVFARFADPEAKLDLNALLGQDLATWESVLGKPILVEPGQGTGEGGEVNTRHYKHPDFLRIVLQLDSSQARIDGAYRKLGPDIHTIEFHTPIDEWHGGLGLLDFLGIRNAEVDRRLPALIQYKAFRDAGRFSVGGNSEMDWAWSATWEPNHPKKKCDVLTVAAVAGDKYVPESAGKGARRPVVRATVGRRPRSGKPDLMGLVGKPIPDVLAALGVKGEVVGVRRPIPDRLLTPGVKGDVAAYESSATYNWDFSFVYPGAEEGGAHLTSKDPQGKNVFVFKMGIYFKRDIGERNALILAGLNPNEWRRRSPREYLSSPKYPKMLVKYNKRPFVNFETYPKKACTWGLEIAKDPYYP